MGIQLSVSTIKMMKSIFFACLVAAVYAEAEPKADADAYYGLGYSGVVPGYTGYALPGAYRPYAAYGAYATPTTALMVDILDMVMLPDLMLPLSPLLPELMLPLSPLLPDLMLP